jgi:predicted aldo/keto reductase-like oxidoreductase
MNTMEQLLENLKIADEGLPDSLSPVENEVMEQVKQAYKDKIRVECSACGYCMPCPSGINIPQCLSYLNQAAMLNDITNVQGQYYFMLKDTEHASKCLECGLCEEMCSQKITIREKLKEVKEIFGD